MTLRNRLSELVQACFSGIWIESHEHQDAIADIAELCRNEDWRLAIWDIDQGLRGSGDAAEIREASDPLAAIRTLSSMATPSCTSILVLQNFHRFLGSPEIIQATCRAVTEGKANRTFVVVLAPLVQLPPELEKLFLVVEHELPGREQLEEIARGIATEEGELPAGAQLETLLDAAAGLTRFEAEGAFSLSLVRDGHLSADAVWELKTQALKKSGLLELHRGGDEFSQLGGLESLKAFCRRSLLRPGRSQSGVHARGVLLLGVPGVGKSAFAKSLGRETGRPTLTLDVGSLMGSLVGETEGNVRRALSIIDAMQPCICFLDEVEKALSGASGGQHDSGVSSRMFGTLLSWLSDHQSDVFVVCTANDVSKLPPEFARAERFDAIFFLDLPRAEDRDAIWRMYVERFGLDAAQRRPEDEGWTGAEIRSCCRLAALLDLPLLQAARNVVPVSVTAAESVDRLRKWADGRCLSADEPGIYRLGSVANKSRRKVARCDPSAN